MMLFSGVLYAPKHQLTYTIISYIIMNLKGIYMAELEFKSTLSNEEIEQNFSSIDFFSGIMSGLEEALAYEKGSAKASKSFLNHYH